MLILTNTSYAYPNNIFAFSSLIMSSYLRNFILYITLNSRCLVLGRNRINGYTQVSLEVSLECSKVSQVSDGDEN